ncbi:MAG: replicative DNA helicase [Coriobacteriia bacterium]|nr:replicative DNA helicase [Coriobacteriia bacterium]
MENTARIPPHNLDAERALLGAMMLSKEIQIEASGALTCDDFYSTRHQSIFEAMQAMTARNISYDVLTLADKLESMGKLESVGGIDYLVEVSTSITATSYWERYATIVRRLSTYRQLITAGNQIVTMAYEAPDDTAEAVGFAEQSIMSVTEQRLSNDFTLLENQLIPTFEEFEYLTEHKGKLTGIPTGFSDLDKKTHGLRPGELIILGARPAVGKSSLALNIATGAAKQGVHVAIFSLEMTVKDIVSRILCAEAEVSLTHVRDGNLSIRDWTEITSAMSRLEGYQISIDDTPSLNITELRAKARRELRNNEGNGLVIVDYLQLMQPVRRNTENRQVEIAEISRGLKILAKDLQIPVLALSQLSREIETRKGQRPQLSDLRESGAIEQDADIVMFLDRLTNPGIEEEEGRPRRGQANLIIAKNRNGPTGEIKLAFREMYTKFQQVAPTQRENEAP